MVHSGAKRTSQLSSYINGDFGGGVKKAGLPYQIGRTAAISYAFRQTSQNLIVLKGRKFELNYHLQIAIMNFEDKQRAVIEAQAVYDAAADGSQAQADALEALNLANTERDAALLAKDAAQAAYESVA